MLNDYYRAASRRVTLMRAGAALVGALALAGCAGWSAQRAPDDEVKARAQARWDAVVAGDWQKAYSFATPAYRASVDLYEFRRKADGLIKYKKAEVLEAKCEEATSCKVKIRITFAPLQDNFGDISTVIEERWLTEVGEWWRYTET